MRSLHTLCGFLLLAALTPTRAADLPFSDALLARAVAEPAPRWKGTPGKRSGELPRTFALQPLSSDNFFPLWSALFPPPAP